VLPGNQNQPVCTRVLAAAGLLLAFPVRPAQAQSEQTGSGQPTMKPDDDGYRLTAEPFFRKFCIGCHGPDLQEGEFRVDDDLKNDFLNLTTKGHWGEVVNILNSYEMPPEGEKQPSSREVSRVVDWITEQMVRAELVRRDT